MRQSLVNFYFPDRKPKTPVAARDRGVGKPEALFLKGTTPNSTSSGPLFINGRATYLHVGIDLTRTMRYSRKEMLPTAEGFSYQRRLSGRAQNVDTACVKGERRVSLPGSGVRKAFFPAHVMTHAQLAPHA